MEHSPHKVQWKLEFGLLPASELDLVDVSGADFDVRLHVGHYGVNVCQCRWNPACSVVGAEIGFHVHREVQR